MTELKRQMPPLRGEGVTCLILRCTHSRYENEMTPQLDSRPRLLTTQLAPIAALSGRRLIEKAAAPPPAYLLVLVARSEVKSVVRRKNRSRPYQVIR
ncbi:hypothetical protein DEO72_LG8g916 [Vigna unguiculata]|uniref:Uncharacterized protein n=1 Tax=Vigna unguiculata TaxID=3917 RepID=A0A4D6MMX8_VIGUN|nr:hypothetical protein DEO72_LG8g916 [Vigna unguiculata]